MTQLVGTDKLAPWRDWGVREVKRHGEWFLYGRRLRTYSPLAIPELPGHFAALPTERFLETYGPLGWKFTHRAEENQGWREEIEEKHADLIEELGFDHALSAEPAEWVEAHRATMIWCLHAATHLGHRPTRTSERRSREEGAVRILESLPRVIGSSNIVSFPFVLGNRLPPVPRLARFLSQILRSNLHGVSRRVESDDSGELQTSWGAISLIENIYSLAADAITASRLRVCEHCGKPFVQTDLRQRFCPSVREGAKSTCMNTALVRRKRAKAAKLKRREP